MDTFELQRLLNIFRKEREPSLRPIPVTGNFDQATADALRAFQHEHNLFMGERLLTESGVRDADTIAAIVWWRSVLKVSA